MYAKVFAQIFDSSIADDYKLRHFFMDLLVLADSEGVVDMTATAISARTRIPLCDVSGFLIALESPDLESRTADYEGRRIKKIDEHRSWGWVILNYDRFREIATEEQRRLKTRQRVRKHREKMVKSIEKQNVTPCNTLVTPPYAYACTSASDLGKGGMGEGEGINVAFWLKVEIGKHYNRKPDDHWSYAEESALVEVSKRSEAIREWDEIRGYCFGMEDRKFFPQSVLSILEKWTQTLDKSRASIPPNPTSKMKILQEQIDTHPANRESVYHSAKATQEQKDGLKKMMSDLTAAKRSMV